MGSIAISCVMDDQPKFHMQTWNWLLSLHACGAMERIDPIVHYLGSPPEAFLDLLIDAGAKICPIDAFKYGVAAASYCNKLQQLASPLLRDVDHVILSDTDVVFAETPERLVCGENVRAKVVDLANPPTEMLQQLLSLAGFADEVLNAHPDFDLAEKTHRYNCNGGIYVFPRSTFEAIGKPWRRWAEFCLEQRDILQDRIIHSDQISFVLAMLEIEHPFLPASIADNFPIHLTSEKYASISRQPIAALHCHNKLNDHGLIDHTQVDWIDQQIDSLNARVKELRRSWFSNEVFWNFRYAHYPVRGSGIGSRGEALKRKQTLLAPFAARYSENDVIDIGFGDLETTRELPFKNYVGVDASARAVKIAENKRPDWRFEVGSVDDLPDDSADLVICLDVLFHIPSAEACEIFISHLVRISRGEVLLSGHLLREHAPKGGIVFFHEPLLFLINKNPEVESVELVGKYSDATLVHVSLKKKP